jgi:type II secretory pathway pseudopilin PulG
MIRIRKYYITLVEVLLVVTLLIMMSGLVAVNIRSLMHEQRFESEVSLIIDELRLAQDLLLILRQDTGLVFQPASDNGGLSCTLTMDKNLPNDWSRVINKKRPPLKAIKKISFQNKVVSTESKERIELKFQSGGSIMSQGILTFSSSENPRDEQALIRSICLPGYPSSLINIKGPIEKNACPPHGEIEYNDKLTFMMMREIGDRDQKDNLSPN